MDSGDDVFEIPPPPQITSRFKRKKQSTVHDVIHIDSDEDSDDVVITGEKESKHNKRKAIAAVYEDHQVIDEYALLLQAHFDSVDIPTGIEAPINLLPEYDLVLNKTGNSTLDKMKYVISDASKNRGSVGNLGAINLPHAARDGNDGKSLDHPVLAKSDDVSDDIMRKFRSFKQFDIVEDASDHYYFRHYYLKQNPEEWAKAIQKDWRILEKDLPDSIFVRVYESRRDLMRAVIVGPEGTPYHDGLFFFDVHFTSRYPSEAPEFFFRSGCVGISQTLFLENGFSSISFLSTTWHTWSHNQGKEKWIPSVSTMLQVLVSIQGFISNTKPYFDDDGSDFIKKMNYGRMNGEKASQKYNENTFIQSLRLMMNTIYWPPKYFENFVLGHFRSRSYDILMACKAYMKGVQVGHVVRGGVQDVYEVNGSCSEEFKKSLAEIWEDACESFFKVGAKDYEKILLIEKAKSDEIMRKFRSFKQFDIVEDASDHIFFRHNSSVKQNPKKWAKAIRRDWKILEKGLPDSIFVRVYESRLDLLRAVIIGAEGTPYHDGLFFVDVHFPGSYPSQPPLVSFHSAGLDLNPNIMGGKLCLSLLDGMNYSHIRNESWLPSVSTMLQVLVSIQGLVLTAKPTLTFTEPAQRNALWGEKVVEERSKKYTEETFILSLRLMMSVMKRPKKHFEDFVVGHFCSRGHDILMACKAYMEGVQVGCAVKGGVQDVEDGNGSCSQEFKKSLARIFKEVCQSFCKCGAKDCEKFLLTEKA